MTSDIIANNSTNTNADGTRHYGILTTASTEDVKKCNIYDMAGNLWEWTEEIAYDLMINYYNFNNEIIYNQILSNEINKGSSKNVNIVNNIKDINQDIDITQIAYYSLELSTYFLSCSKLSSEFLLIFSPILIVPNNSIDIVKNNIPPIK